MTKKPSKTPSDAPTISTELVAWLEKAYPDKAIDPSLPLHEQHARFGEVRLVRNLRVIHDRQREKAKV